MSDLLVHPAPESDGTILRVSPSSAGWRYVGFEVLELGQARVAQRDTGDREVCLVVGSGSVDVRYPGGHWPGLGGRPDPWSGPPDACYLPPGTRFELRGAAPGTEVALCWAPAPGGGASPRLLPGEKIEVETRGYGAQERTIHPILMGDRAAYYRRISPARGFGLQRVYSEDRSLDETLAFGDRDCVLVPRGYHTVSAPPGYDVYYLNVMAGPTRLWAVANDPDHEWTLVPEEQP